MRVEVQSYRWLSIVAYAAAIWQIGLTCLILPGTLEHDVTNVFIRISAIVPTLLWYLSMLTKRKNGTAWMMGAVTFPLHVLIAFHLGHAWSHTEAMSHVEQTSGWGPGLFVSYAFGVVWFVDAMWLWIHPSSYRTRSKWLDRAMIGFLAFIVFNATVVYGGEFARWAGVAMFVMLGWRLLKTAQ
ncbi:hypothetical protein BH11PLA2_BH11PLA2_04480 [soil metagenome]